MLAKALGLGQASPGVTTGARSKTAAMSVIGKSGPRTSARLTQVEAKTSCYGIAPCGALLWIVRADLLIAQVPVPDDSAGQGLEVTSVATRHSSSIRGGGGIGVVLKGRWTGDVNVVRIGDSGLRVAGASDFQVTLLLSNRIRSHISCSRRDSCRGVVMDSLSFEAGNLGDCRGVVVHDRLVVDVLALFQLWSSTG